MESIKKYSQKLFGNQLRKNIVSGTFVHGINVLVAFFSYTFYINHLGFESFSVWVLLSVILSFAHFGDFGIGRAVINFIATEHHLNNKKRLSEIISNALTIIIVVSIIIQIILVVFSRRITLLLNVPYEYLSESIAIIPLIGLSMFAFLIFDCLRSIIIGIGRLDLSNILLLSLNIFKVIITLIFLNIRADIHSMIYGVIVSNVIFIGFTIIFLSKQNLGIIITIRQINKQGILELLQYGSSIIGIQTINIFIMPLVKVSISRFLGIEHVGYFELSTKAAYSFRTLIEKGLFAFLPEFSKFSKDFKNNEEIRKTLKKKVLHLTRLCAYYGIPFLLLITIFSKFLLQLWLGKSFHNFIYIGYLYLQPGIIVGLLALPSYYALLAVRKQRICFYEALIRFIILVVLFQLFHVCNLSFIWSTIFFSISAVISNIYVIIKFFQRE